jgi:hypothetical protein
MWWHLLYSVRIFIAHVQLLLHTGDIWFILWLWKILAQHRFSVLSVLTIFQDWLVVLPQYPERLHQSVQPLFDCFFVSLWTCSPPLFHHFGHTRRCGNWRVTIFTTKLADTFSVLFFSRKRFDNKHTLFSGEFHLSQPSRCTNECDILDSSSKKRRDPVYLKIREPFVRVVIGQRSPLFRQRPISAAVQNFLWSGYPWRCFFYAMPMLHSETSSCKRQPTYNH